MNLYAKIKCQGLLGTAEFVGSWKTTDFPLNSLAIPSVALQSICSLLWRLPSLSLPMYF